MFCYNLQNTVAASKKTVASKPGKIPKQGLPTKVKYVLTIALGFCVWVLCMIERISATLVLMFIANFAIL